MCWFKPTATEHIAKVREISCILQQNGVYVRLIKAQRPGYVIYEDEYQVVAEPFADLDL